MFKVIETSTSSFTVKSTGEGTACVDMRILLEEEQRKINRAYYNDLLYVMSFEFNSQCIETCIREIEFHRRCYMSLKTFKNLRF